MITIAEMNKHIYFIANSSYTHVKIGKSQTREGCHRRLSDCQVGNPEPLLLLGIVPPMKHLGERYLHQRFQDDYVRGEWFQLSNQIAAYIQLNAERPTRPTYTATPTTISETTT